MFPDCRSVCAASVHGLFVQPELPQRKCLWILVVILETNPGQTTFSMLQTEAALWRWSERVTVGGQGSVRTGSFRGEEKLTSLAGTLDEDFVATN